MHANASQRQVHELRQVTRRAPGMRFALVGADAAGLLVLAAIVAGLIWLAFHLYDDAKHEHEKEKRRTRIRRVYH